MPRFLSLSLSLFLFLLIVPVSHAAGWGERGVSKNFTIAGERLYAADGRGVTVYDISNPASMRSLDVESGDDESLDVALYGATDVVLATRGGLERFDVAADGTLSRMGTWRYEGGVSLVAANATAVAGAAGNEVLLLERTADALTLLRRVRFSDRVLSMAFGPSHLFVTVQAQGIYVVDPSSGEQVAIISRASEDLALSGSTLWSASSTGGLNAIDVRNPLSPEVISTTGVGSAMDGVAAAGTRVYVFNEPDTIHFFDASDITQPRLAATRREWVNVAAARGTTLFFSGPRLDRDGFTYETGTPVRALDAAAPASPSIVGEVRDLAGPVSGVWTDGSLAYVVDVPFFRVLDVSKSDAPRELTSIELPYAAPQLSVRVKNGMAFVYGREYVHLVDLTDPVRPRLKATWDPRGYSPNDVAPMADGLFVEVNQHSGIHVVNYKEYDPPVQVGGRISHWHAVVAGDDALYTLAGYLLTMSVTDRARARDTSIIFQYGHDLETAPPNADRPPLLVLAQSGGLRIYTLEIDRFEPLEMAFIPVANPREMATTASSVVVDVGGTLHLLDLTLTSLTRLVPTDMRVTSAMQISMAGEKIVVADRYRVRVYGPDTPPPPSPATSKRRSVRR